MVCERIPYLNLEITTGKSKRYQVNLRPENVNRVASIDLGAKGSVIFLLSASE